MEILYVVGCIVIVKRSFLMLFVKIWLEMVGNLVGVVMSPPHNGRVTNVILMVLV